MLRSGKVRGERDKQIGVQKKGDELKQHVEGRGDVKLDACTNVAHQP